MRFHFGEGELELGWAPMIRAKVGGGGDLGWRLGAGLRGSGRGKHRDHLTPPPSMYPDTSIRGFEPGDGGSHAHRSPTDRLRDTAPTTAAGVLHRTAIRIYQHTQVQRRWRG